MTQAQTIENSSPPRLVTPADETLLTRDQVAARYCVHQRTVPDLVAQGRIPKPLEGWSGKGERWLLSEVVLHMWSLRQAERTERVA